MEHRTMTDVWAYRHPGWLDSDFTGFEVEAVDGYVGKVDQCSREVGAGYIVVDTGRWIFGNKVLLPAGVIQEVDLDSEKLYVDRMKEEIKEAPEFDEARYREPLYRDELGDYYATRAADRTF